MYYHYNVYDLKTGNKIMMFWSQKIVEFDNKYGVLSFACEGILGTSIFINCKDFYTTPDNLKPWEYNFAYTDADFVNIYVVF